MSDYQLKQINALIVEDYDVSSMIIKDMLSTIGVKSKIATNMEEAITQVKESAFDVIFMDVQLGNESGLDVTRKIREMEIEQPLIIACTANNAITSKDEVIESGMDDYLTKPVNIQSFRDMLIKHNILEG